MKITDLFQPRQSKPEPPVPARCPPCAADVWRDVAAGFARSGRTATHDQIEEEVCRQLEKMTARPPPQLFE